MENLIQLMNSALSQQQYRFAAELIKGIRNGIVYGCKIRFPHAVVMTFLFKSGPLSEKLRNILQLTVTHARNLGSFALIYKICSRLLLKISGGSHRWHAFVAAFITGYIVFGSYNKVNEQVNLYLLSRVLYGFGKLLVKQEVVKPPSNSFPLFAGLVWACALYLFEFEGDTLQASLRASMTYIYHDSQRWTNVIDWIVYNQMPAVN